MTFEKRVAYIGRLELVVRNVQGCIGGRDIHTVASIRHTALMLLEYLYENSSGDQISDERVEQMVKNVEAKCVDFFKKKYGKT